MKSGLAKTDFNGTQILCIDAGFTHTRLAVWTGAELLGYSRTRSPQKRDLETVEPTAEERRAYWLQNLARLVSEMRSKYPQVTRIGLCFPGVVRRDGVILKSNSIWGGSGREDLYPHELTALLGLPVFVFNDVAAAAMRYGYDSRYQDCETVLVVSIGSGIGAKTFNRRCGGIILGAQGRNGEIALMVVESSPQALTNDNGRLKGVLGNYSSGVGFARMLRNKASDESFADSSLYRLVIEAGADIASIDRHALNRLAVQALKEGDVHTLSVLTESIGYLAKALHAVILYEAPSAVVLTGGIVHSIGTLYRELMVTELSKRFTYMYDSQELATMISTGPDDDLDNLIGCGIWTEQLSACVE